ncbi:MAG: hypothetical protein JSV41_10215 [Gemmatimonadota bacterium]|nr:MAG: hypothetical protein JSV41_10215 [Gemmatimonadota bacterium]
MKLAAQLAIVAWIGLAASSTVRAQEPLESELQARCERAELPSELLNDLCQDVVASLQLAQPELGLLLAGGNPVLGTASPIGARFRFIPRVHIGGRINFVWADVPDIIDYPSDTLSPLGTLGFVVPMPQADISIGVFEGFELGTTLGGFASLELLGTLSTLLLPSGDGFEANVSGFGLGARVGLLRESFTAPGISVSGLYKWLGRVQLGNVDEGDDAEFGADMRVASFRAGLSKSFVALGLALTLGYDNYWSDIDFAIATAPGVVNEIVSEDSPFELASGRWSAFVDVSYILLFVNIVAEVGWQEEQRLAGSRELEIESGNLFAALGIRLTL